jgi:YteA family regulatory protein
MNLTNAGMPLRDTTKTAKSTAAKCACNLCHEQSKEGETVDQEKLAYFKKRLLEERESLLKGLKDHHNYNLEENMSDAFSEFSMYDNHPADVGTEMFEREKDLSLYLKDRETLREIDAALERIENGTYGICTVSGKPIPLERLEAIPYAATLKEHAPAPQLNNSRPIEEEFLQPPFGRTSLDEQEEYNGFDGEDAWQIVESWGTSSTPFSFVDNDKTSYNEMYVESDEPDGFVEAVEEIGYTDLHGYHGPDSVQFMRSGTYEEYVRKREGVGHFLDYEDYEQERAEREGRSDLL